jgi:hypothetical protein
MTVNHLHGHGPSLAAIGLGVLMALVAVALAKGALVLGGITRRRAHLRRARTSELEGAAAVEARARALMSELCPQGWRAQITLFGPNDELPADAPPDPDVRVVLDWAELEGEGRRAAVIRRVWAHTIGEALDAMVSDRRTDETLEQIERGALTDGASWSDS